MERAILLQTFLDTDNHWLSLQSLFPADLKGFRLTL